MWPVYFSVVGIFIQINNSLQIGFLTEWQMYAQQLEGDTWRGEKMNKAKIEKMSDQQIAQLYELMQAIQKGEAEEGEVDEFLELEEKKK